ncbi:MAG: NfeD family protein [Syntrophomonadales bacterium]|jgi:membrane-bound serine protease (ClpP class)
MVVMALLTPVDWAVAIWDAALWTIILGALFLAAVIYAIINIRRFRPVHGNDEFGKSRAVVTEDLDPEGRVMVQGEIWRASSPTGEMIARGQRVKVIGREGMYLLVEPLQTGNPKMMGGKEK